MALLDINQRTYETEETAMPHCKLSKDPTKLSDAMLIFELDRLNGRLVTDQTISVSSTRRTSLQAFRNKGRLTPDQILRPIERRQLEVAHIVLRKAGGDDSAVVWFMRPSYESNWIAPMELIRQHKFDAAIAAANHKGG